MTAKRRVAVVVLGDLGRSPRMQYHALALAADGADVDLVGYAGRPVDQAVADEPRIQTHFLPAPLRQRAPRALFLPAAVADVVAQSAALAALLLRLPRPDVVLVQNPPAIPTLILGRTVAALRSARLVIDWHNFGADMLALRLGRTHPAVRAAAAVERRFGHTAHAHLCVSDAMRAELAARWDVPGAHVLRDRPAKQVGPTPLPARRALFQRLELGVDPSDANRPAVVVTSSSWTADEDFSLLLVAIARYDARVRARIDLPDLLVVMTGDGPMRAQWEARIAALGLTRVRVRTLWVAAEDYPVLLGSAELGLSFHRSASGVDLPMKISDMFGAGLPVCALAYGPVLGELVIPGQNGLHFTTGDELADQLCALLVGFPARTTELDRLRAGVARLAARGWAEGWRDEARAVFHQP